MYVASIFKRKNNYQSSNFCSDEHEQNNALDRERREFIRTAAITIAATPDRSEVAVTSGHDGDKFVNTVCSFPTPAQAVDRAQNLWAELLARDC